MSATTHARDANTARILALSPLEQRICLSFLGLDVWRLHRERDLQPSLLLALHAPADEFDAFTWGIHQVFEALPKTDRFSTLSALSHVLAAGTAQLSRHDRVVANTYHCGVDVRTLADQYGVDPIDNLEVRWAGELATFLLDVVFDNAPHDVYAFKPWVDVWFELCDAAAGVTA